MYPLLLQDLRNIINEAMDCGDINVKTFARVVEKDADDSEGSWTMQASIGRRFWSWVFRKG